MSFNGPDPQGFTSEPSNAVEEMVQATFDAIAEACESQGGRLRFMYVSIVTEGLSADGEPDAVSAATGSDLPDNPSERAASVVAWLISEAKQTAERLGAEVRVLPLERFNEG